MRKIIKKPSKRVKHVLLNLVKERYGKIDTLEQRLVELKRNRFLVVPQYAPLTDDFIEQIRNISAIQEVIMSFNKMFELTDAFLIEGAQQSFEESERLLGMAAFHINSFMSKILLLSNKSLSLDEAMHMRDQLVSISNNITMLLMEKKEF